MSQITRSYGIINFFCANGLLKQKVMLIPTAVDFSQKITMKFLELNYHAIPLK
jgi:hypothetical protein